MNVNEVIDCYVIEVALQLPRRQRHDVAFELRALIEEGLQDQAQANGLPADAAMATRFLNGMGRPAEVAARYRPALTVIDPEDGQAFVRATVIGLAVIWSLGLLLRLSQPLDGSGGLVAALALWWGSTVIPSLWWPGMLVVGFAGAAWSRRRWPVTTPWQARAKDRIQGGRVTLVLGIVGIACGLYTLLHPRWMLDFFWSGQAAPAAYAALTYTDAFRHGQAPWLLALLLLNVPMLASVVVHGRWSPRMRRLQAGLALLTCAVMAWAIADGPILMAPASDQTAKFCMGLIIVATLADLLWQQARQIRPMPQG